MSGTKDSGDILTLPGNANQYSFLKFDDVYQFSNGIEVIVLQEYQTVAFGDRSFDLGELDTLDRFGGWDDSDFGTFVLDNPITEPGNSFENFFRGNANEFKLVVGDEPGSFSFIHHDYGTTTIFVSGNEIVSFDDVSFTGMDIQAAILRDTWDYSAFGDLISLSGSITLKGNANEYELGRIASGKFVLTHAFNGTFAIDLGRDDTLTFDDSAFTFNVLAIHEARETWDSSAYGTGNPPVEDTTNNLTDVMSATASQSSTHSAHAAMETFAGEDAFRVIDNDVTTHNHTNVRNGANAVTIDLNGDAFIEEIAIENGVWNARAANRLVDATVKVLKDGVVVWHNVDDGNTAVTHHQYQTLIVDGGVVGDQILIENNTYLHLKEVDVFGDLNLTDVMNATASVSSSWENDGAGYGAAYVLDGDITTFNHTHRDDKSAPSLEINLGADAFIETIVLANRNDGSAHHQALVNARLAGAKLEILDDGVVVGPAFTLTREVDQKIDIGGVIGETIRITNGDEYLHIAEIDVFGDQIA